MREHVLRAHVWLVAVLIPALDHAASLRRLVRWLTPPSWLRPYAGMEPERVAAAVRERLRRPRHMRRRACLREGLALFHFLRLAGLHAALHFCVYPEQPGDKRLHGHCWVTLDGQPISAPPEGSHALLWTHGSSGGRASA